MDTKIPRPAITQCSDECRTLARQSEAWMLYLHSGEATYDDLAVLRQWRLQSPAHEAAWQEMVRWWHVLGIAMREFVARHPELDFPVSHHLAGDTVRSRRSSCLHSGTPHHVASSFTRPPQDIQHFRSFKRIR